jgi:hypothetical protein
MNSVYLHNNVITQTQKTDEEIFREEGIKRRIEITKDLRKDVQIAFHKYRENPLNQHDSSSVHQTITSINDEMKIDSAYALKDLVYNCETQLNTILDTNLKKIRTFFYLNLSPETREQLTTLFPAGKEKLKVVEVSLIVSLVKEIEIIVNEYKNLYEKVFYEKITTNTISNMMLSNKKKLYQILIIKNRITFLKVDEIENIRRFTQEKLNLPNIENRFPILFSKKLLEIDNGTLFVNSEASDPALPIQNFVSNFETSDKASKTNPNKRSFDQSKNRNDEVNPQHRKKQLIPVEIPSEIRNDIKKDYKLCKQRSKKNTMTFPSKKMELPTENTLSKIINPRPNRNSVNNAIEGGSAKTNVAVNNPLSLSNNLFKPLSSPSSPPSLSQQVQPKTVSSNQQKVNEITSTPLPPPQIPQENNIATFPESLDFWDVKEYINNDYDSHDNLLPNWNTEDGQEDDITTNPLDLDSWIDSLQTKPEDITEPELKPEQEETVVEFEYPDLFPSLWNPE